MLVGVNAYFLAHPHTGSGQYLAELARRLPRLRPDWEFRWYAPAGLRVPEVGLPQPLGVPVGALPGHWGKLYFEQIAFPAQARRDGCDAVFVPYFGPPSRFQERAVVTVHDTIPLLLPAYRRGPLARAYGDLVRANAGKCRLLLADSMWTKRDAIQLIGAAPDRVAVVPLGVSETMAPVCDQDTLERVRTRYHLPPKYLLYLGSFDRRKRVEVLLAAHAELLGRLSGEAPDLVLAGKIPECGTAALLDVRRAVQQAGRSERVHLIGAPAEEDKAALYSGAAAFVFPSEYEGFGLPPLEAMACGTPVVAANASSVPEVCGDAALQVRPGDPAALADALEALLHDADLRARLIERGLAQAASFTWESTARMTLEALEEAS